MDKNGLPIIHRFVTDHDTNGKAIFNSDIEEILLWNDRHNTVRFGLGYTTTQTPVDLNDAADIKSYKAHQKSPPGIMIPGGSVLRYVDVPPGHVSEMHRTVSLDFGVVLEGVVDLVLDSGEVRRMNRGDCAIQRGTNHEWRNASKDQWARMMYVLQEAKPISLEGKQLGEDYGGMQDVKPSGN
jgi:quercetin dioxygenase-like cupin family protein